MMKPDEWWSSIRTLGTSMKLWTMWSTIARWGGSPREMMKDGGTALGGQRQMTLIRVVHPQMKMAGLPKWERGLGRVRVGSPRDGEEGNAGSASQKHTNTPIQQVPTQIEADQANQIQEL